MGLVETILIFMIRSEQKAGENVARQQALYTGLQCEELAEKLQVLFGGTGSVKMLNALSTAFKEGKYDENFADMTSAQRAELVDADIDLSWVSIGSMFSFDADVFGAIHAVTEANMAKVQHGVLRDENGKIKKPEGWVRPDLTKFVR